MKNEFHDQSVEELYNMHSLEQVEKEHNYLEYNNRPHIIQNEINNAFNRVAKNKESNWYMNSEDLYLICCTNDYKVL